MSRKLTKRSFLQNSLALLSTLWAGAPPLSAPAANNAESLSGSETPRIPIILDSDIGDDIDDTWALLMLLRMPQFDVKLVVSDFGNAIYRCRLFAKLLELTGRTDIPIGVGLGREDQPGRQSGWIGDYRLEDYPGVVRRDGVQALIDTI
ncbi:MAG: nucleoside hydrolase, partial [Gammaproteobacteria bacterium]|nr:nucleoside hydrolase [Gammaproteobacteria bacterium]